MVTLPLFDDETARTPRRVTLIRLAGEIARSLGGVGRIAVPAIGAPPQVLYLERFHHQFVILLGGQLERSRIGRPGILGGGRDDQRGDQGGGKDRPAHGSVP